MRCTHRSIYWRPIKPRVVFRAELAHIRPSGPRNPPNCWTSWNPRAKDGPDLPGHSTPHPGSGSLACARLGLSDKVEAALATVSICRKFTEVVLAIELAAVACRTPRSEIYCCWCPINASTIAVAGFANRNAACLKTFRWRCTRAWALTETRGSACLCQPACCTPAGYSMLDAVPEGVRRAPPSNWASTVFGAAGQSRRANRSPRRVRL